MSTLRSPRPLHPFPHLVAPQMPLPHGPTPPTAAERRVLALLADGVRVLFDIEAKRALLYSVRHGLRTVGQMTVRTLARLIREGWLVMTGREGRLVHYAVVPAGVNP
jgi:hypothetical protein